MFKRKFSLFLNKGYHIFILYWILQSQSVVAQGWWGTRNSRKERFQRSKRKPLGVVEDIYYYNCSGYFMKAQHTYSKTYESSHFKHVQVIESQFYLKQLKKLLSYILDFEKYKKYKSLIHKELCILIVLIFEAKIDDV